MKEKTLGGEAARLTVSKIITLVISMATAMLLARFRTVEEYGTYSELLLSAGLAITLFTLGLPNSINYFLVGAESNKEKRSFLSVYYSLTTLLSAFIGLMMVLFIPVLERYFHNSSLVFFSYFLALYPWTYIVISSIDNVLLVYQKANVLMAFRFIYSILMLAGVLIIQYMGLGFSEYMIAYTCINVGLALSVYIIVHVLCGGIFFSINMIMVKRILAFSIPLGLATLVGTINTELDKLLVGYLMTTEQMAIYTNAAKELPLSIIATSIAAVLMPKMTLMVKKKRIDDAIELWKYATEFAFIIMALIVSGVFTYAEDVVSILYSEKYLPGVPVFRVYTLNLLFRVTYFGMMLNAYGCSNKIFYCSVASLILNAIMNPIFFKMFGIIGPAIATLMAIAFIQFLQLKMTAGVSGKDISRLYPWKETLINLCFNTLLALIFYYIKMTILLDRSTGETAESLILGAVWTFLYFICVRKRLLFLWGKLNKDWS